jgi:lysyl-tRNA synthetase class II
VTEEWNDLVRERMRKADEVRRRGGNPYPNDQRVGWTTADAKRIAEGKEAKDLEREGIRVDIAGRVVATRHFGKASGTSFGWKAPSSSPERES